MRLTASLARKMLRLLQGESLPYSQLKYSVIDRMVEEGVLTLRSAGTRKTVYCRNTTTLQGYIKNHFGVADLEQFVAVLEQKDLHRSDAVRIASDSKIKSIRSFKGFLVNCYDPLMTTLDGVALEISPRAGIFTYIHDFEDFIPAADIIIIGVENGENFRHIEQQQKLFSFSKILFVSRYPQSGDLIQWLRGIPNHYVHFGDFDFSGINIYLHEFKRHLSDRAEFFVPDGIAELLRTFGNRELYQRQLSHAPSRESLDEPALESLWDLICAEKKGLEQEVLITPAET